MALREIHSSLYLPHGSLYTYVYEDSISVSGNYSNCRVVSILYADSGWGPSFHGSNSYSVAGGGSGSGSFTLSVPNGGSQTFRIQSFRVYHAANGTGSTQSRTNVGNTTTSTFGGGGTTPYAALTLTTIPRTSHPSVSPSSVDAGDSVTISTNRASGSFTHTLTYKFGVESGTIGTGVGASKSWTPPLSLLDQIPNSTSGKATITCKTYSGSKYIGSDTVRVTIKAPSSVTPTIGSITDSETVTVVGSTVGTYVQSLSKLALGITGAAGAYGSTIETYKLTVAGQTINASSGTTAGLNASGTVTITGRVTDTRGRVGILTKTVTVLPYSLPSVTSRDVERATSGGVADDNGTYFNIIFKADVQSLINGSQKNELTYRLSTREVGATSWTIQTTITPGGISFDGTKTIGTFPTTTGWDVLIEVLDKFATSAVLFNVTTGKVLLDLHGSDGVGIGKYHEDGMLDVGGNIYQNGNLVLDTTNIPEDTGFLTNISGISWEAGWANDYNSFRHTGAVIDMTMSFYYSGSTVTADGAANIADRLIATIPAGWRPHGERLIAGGRDGYNAWSFRLESDGVLRIVAGSFPGQKLTSGDRLYISTMYMG